MLSKLQPDGIESEKPVVIYTTRYCPYCIRAKRLLEARGIDYQEISVDGDAGRRQEMTRRAGRHTVPQIWIRGRHIGGCDELMLLDREQGLVRFLKE